MIVCLLENNNAHISRLGECLEINSAANVMGCMQRILRFLSNERISPTITVLPLIRLMRLLLENLPEIVLAMDRMALFKNPVMFNDTLTELCHIPTEPAGSSLCRGMCP